MDAWSMPDLVQAIQFWKKLLFCYFGLLLGILASPVRSRLLRHFWNNPPQAVSTLTCVLHVVKNASVHFQAHVHFFSTIEKAFDSYIDDLIIYSKGLDDLLKFPDTFFGDYEKLNLKLSAKKCWLHMKEVKWGGRIISDNVYRIDPRNTEASWNMSFPQQHTACDRLCMAVDE